MLNPSSLGLVLLAVVGIADAAKDPDYIIVGGGTAGLALATRLSLGLPKANILVIEAGPAAPDEVRINVPGLRGSTLGSEYDWGFATVPQPPLNGRTVDVNRGKVLGGSAALNYLCYDRASEAEYDSWGDLIDSSQWSFNKIFKAMLKSENYTSPDDGNKHGKSGPIRSTYNRLVPSFLSTWKPTLKKLGVPINDAGSLSGDPIGVSFQTTNIDPTKYTRSNSFNSYLPLAGRNLVVRPNTRVAKVEFAKRPKPNAPLRAIGVILEDGTKISATTEVILSAGSIQSPGLLELSGIGQSSLLKKAGIPVLQDLPSVGENYQDHIRLSNVYRLKANTPSFDPMIFENSGPFATQQFQLWLDNKISWYDYTSTAYSFMNWQQIFGGNKTAVSALTKLAQSAAQKKNVVDSTKLSYLSDSSVPQMEIIMEANFVGAFAYPGGNYTTLLSSLMHPMSRGSVHINPSSPTINTKPVIDPNYLSNEYDLQALIAGSKFARKIATTEPFKSIWEGVEVEPGPNVNTEEEWRAFAKSTMGSFYHPVGTCAMLPAKDGGVVDADLKVYGTDNLRVVDCSVIPVLPSAHIQTAAYGIAEIAAELVVKEGKKKF
ncbi:hypothetical protein QBC37DRAFT_443170 [Rhypophila decipiens]|uniref:Glucose-methanol-choline oxidoreductase N-terminal domain-containing protein n=1 Tax=Rhypophila decipiens TaxID=261697 RepID=A0AAN6XZC2_9PEZI|nr:hypothetical protein QBC37DRAFT_443170 [Rhypophila decipiens]